MLLKHLACAGQKVLLFFPPPLFPSPLFLWGWDHRSGCHYLNIVCLYYQNKAFSSTPPLSHLISERPLIMTKKRSNRMARIFKISKCKAGLHTCTHTPCILEARLTSLCSHSLPYNVLACQLPREFVEFPSLEVFKNRIKCPSFQDGLGTALLIRRNRLDFSVKVHFCLECS